MAIDTLYNQNELLERIARGDEAAFAALYDLYWKRIYTMALLYLKSPQAAQDMVQDVFVKLWLNKENLLQVREFKPYLFVMARNNIISNLRNKVFHDYLDEDESLEESTMLPEKSLSFKESTDLLHKAIKKLPSQQQRAFKLSRNEGMSYEEIAREMGVSRLTVRTHISKALSFIRQYLTDHAVHPVVLLIALLGDK